MVPTNGGRMCTLTNENVILVRCMTIGVVNTNNVLILIFIFLGHRFLRDGCSIGKQTHVRSKGMGMVIYPLHEFRLRARAAKVQIGDPSTLRRMGREAREQGWVPPIHAPVHGQRGT